MSHRPANGTDGNPPVRRMLDFDPVRDGFPFVNRWTWTEADLAHLTKALRLLSRFLVFMLPVLIGFAAAGVVGFVTGCLLGAAGAGSGMEDRLVRRTARLAVHFGMCGGMAQAAADRWIASRTIGATHPADVEALRTHIRTRQADTFRAGLYRFLRYWMSVHLFIRSRLDAPYGEDLRREVDRITARIRSGLPITLGLVGDTPNPFGMHQVMCYGFEESAGGVTLYVYDPNTPGAARRIHVTWPDENGRFCRIWTDIPTGPRPGGGFHISRRPNDLSYFFAIEVPEAPGKPTG